MPVENKSARERLAEIAEQEGVFFTIIETCLDGNIPLKKPRETFTCPQDKIIVYQDGIELRKGKKHRMSGLSEEGLLYVHSLNLVLNYGIPKNSQEGEPSS